MESIVIRKLSLQNLELIFPTILALILSVYLFTGLDSISANAIAVVFLIIGIVGFIFLVIQFLTRIRVDKTSVCQVRFGKERKIKFEEVRTFEIYKTGRFGNTKLNKNDLQPLAVKSDRIILVSKMEDKLPNPWWKRDANTISIPFQNVVFSLIETRMNKENLSPKA